MTIEAINPATGERLQSYDEISIADAHQAVEAAHEAFLEWRRTSLSSRAALMRAAARILRRNATEYGRLMAQEMGKPLREGVAEAEKCAFGCDFFAEHAAQFLAPEFMRTEARKSFIAFRPLGVILAVMPWNYPFWQVFRFAAPGLMAGNATVLKHASNVPGCALAIEGIFREAGFPKNLYRNLLLESPNVEAVIEHRLVRAATLTGSGAAGRAVAGKAGSLLKKTVLELGGSDPYLILEDADLEAAAALCTSGRLMNAGQSCIAAKRLIVVDRVHDRFVEQFVKRMAATKMGDPLRLDTVMGPLARQDLRDKLQRQVEASIASGAHCVLGGRIPPGRGNFYPPTVLTNVSKGMPASDEELFGPVAAVIRARDEKEAIALANDSSYGLGGGVMTTDLARGERIAVEDIESGMVFVNEHVRSDPRLPFGGIKESGYGRELSPFGIREFVNIKTILVA
jgi:succinate-semialdehyde dehydrogenase / glutarate-semialdehyde dehydrogenase